MARVLVVDDDPGTRHAFELMLRQAGHDVLAAESGTQALQVMQQEKPDVALVELQLLDMTGLDILRKLRDRAIATPCIVVTGYGTIESAVSAMKLGAVDYLTKPLEADDLEPAVHHALAARADHPPAVVRADGLVRWARAIAGVLDAPHDPKNLAEWSSFRGVAPATLRSWCRTAAIPPKGSLDLARILRAVFHGRSRGWPVGRLLEVADRRTLERLLRAAGLSRVERDLPTLNQVLSRQSFIADPAAIEELRRVLCDFCIDLDS
jgi:ActR/RegA family two-component response regulator